MISINPRVFIKNRENTVRINGIQQKTDVRVISKIYPDFCIYLTVEPDAGFDLCLPHSGEYFVDIEPSGPEYAQRIPVFAVEENLAGLIPLQGDLHIHTTFSDGKKEPAAMVNAGRALGLDFMAVTDHDSYNGSVSAVKYAAEAGHDMVVLHGEEVTLPGSGHMLCIGADSPVHLPMMDDESYHKGVAETIAAIKPEDLADGMTAEEYAPVKWIAGIIRKKGGLSVLCHPFWVMETTGMFHLRRNLLMQVLQDRLTDAVEIPGDNLPEDSMLALNLYRDTQWNGSPMPMIANSDTHNDNHTYGHRWSIVFSGAKAKQSILDAIRSGKNVACEKRPECPLQIYGRFELTEYAYFLSREYFPAKDRFAAREAESIFAGNTAEGIVAESARYTADYFAAGVLPRDQAFCRSL